MKFITLNNLSHFASALAEKVKTMFVQKEDGKGLSSNDYTTTEKEKLAALRNYTHPASGVTAGTYRSVSVDKDGHVTAGDNPTTLAGYGITDAAAKSHKHGNGDITGIDASKVTSGVLDIDRIPPAALERCVVVADDTARFALTADNAQNGDTVKVTATGKMYFVKDSSNLGSEAGYELYTAGSAASVPWSGVTGKPSAYTPIAHTHTVSQISDMEEALDADIDNIITGAFSE